MIGAVLAALLLAGLCVPVSAEEPRYWRITVSGLVLSNRTDQIVVFVPHRDEESRKENAMEGAVRTIPVTDQTEFVDREGAALEQSAVLPGQTVRVTFRFTYEENDYGGPPTVRPVHGYRIQLREDVIPVRSSVQPQDLEPMTGIGTIVHITEGDDEDWAGTAYVYIDASHNHTENTSHYRWHTGWQMIWLDKRVAACDERGGSIRWQGLQPGQRVYFKGSIAFMLDAGEMWRSIDYVKLLGDGEMIVSPEAVAGQSFVRCTVLENRGRTELLVKADEQSLIGSIGSVWSIPLLYADYDPGNPKQFPAYAPGDELIVPFERADIRTSPGTLRCIPWQIEPARD